MPIINSVIAGGGTTPTGTKNITANGVYDVTTYASADVQVPTTAPSNYMEYNINSAGLISKGAAVVQFDQIKDVSAECLREAFVGNLTITGTLDLSALVDISGASGFQNSFMNCTNITGVDMGALVSITGSSGASNMFKGCTGITSIDLGSLTSVGSYGAEYMFQNCNGLIGTLDLGSLTAISSYGCQYMFQNCTGITSVDLTGLTSINNNYTCYYMFAGCSGITGALDLSNLTSISGNYACQYMFQYCTSITSVDLTGLTSITGSHACEFMFYNCTGLTGHIDLSNLTTVGNNYAGNKIFLGCTGITSIDLSGLKSISGGYNINEIVKGCTSLVSIDLSSLVYIGSGSWCAGTICENCSSLTTVKLDSLSTIIGSGGLERAFGSCTSLQTLSFPALKQIGDNSVFRNLVNGVTGCTIHFPKNLDPQTGSTVISSLATYPNFSGTNTTLLFDLPATNTLTGADTVTYTRNPKYDTATALAWKAGTHDTTNLTPAYYTSGTTDPAVSDAIYSDAACTTSVTTITAIA